MFGILSNCIYNSYYCTLYSIMHFLMTRYIVYKVKYTGLVKVLRANVYRGELFGVSERDPTGQKMRSFSIIKPVFILKTATPKISSHGIVGEEP